MGITFAPGVVGYAVAVLVHLLSPGPVLLTLLAIRRYRSVGYPRGPKLVLFAFVWSFVGGMWTRTLGAGAIDALLAGLCPSLLLLPVLVYSFRHAGGTERTRGTAWWIGAGAVLGAVACLPFFLQDIDYDFPKARRPIPGYPFVAQPGTYFRFPPIAK